MGLLPDQVWAMTPHEFSLYVDGYGQRIEKQMERLAWHAANIMNSIPYFGKGRRAPITTESLLGRNKQVAFASKEDFVAALKAKQKRREETER